ncbi:MAG: PDZ domain-containing protein [Sphingobacteriales bacterium]|nr:MAG: PDZ domain-containing protein [Sphingobacteriales bacterium]
MNSPMQGYYRFPSVYQDHLVFVSEDDLWLTSIKGGAAHRLTANLGIISQPCFSPDGQYIAFVGSDEGPQEIYVMPSTGGTAKRLTFLGSGIIMAGWNQDKIVFATNYGQPHGHAPALYEVDIHGNLPVRLNKYGPARSISFNHTGGVVLGRHTRDSSYWKRYRGGTAGVLWIDKDGKGEFTKLQPVTANYNCPMFINDRVYFIADNSGVGNICSCKPDGSDFVQHTQHKGFYARNAQTDGNHIVYHAGGDIYLFSLSTNSAKKLSINYLSPRVQRNRKFANAAQFADNYALNPAGSHLCINTRGKIFAFGNWEGSVSQFGDRSGMTRYKHSQWLSDGKRIVAATDQSGQYRLCVFSVETNEQTKHFEHLDIGIPYSIKVSCCKDEAVITNHRQELIWVNLETGDHIIIDRAETGTPFGLPFSWSPDGNWIAYAFPINHQTTAIKLFSFETGQSHQVTRPVLYDFEPVFHPSGKYLLFLSARIFNPVYDNLHFDLNFPKGILPYLITLRKDVPSPFVPVPKSVDEDEEAHIHHHHTDLEQTEKTEKPKEKKPEKIIIDLEGIEDRIVAVPIAEGNYVQMDVCKNKIFYTSYQVEGARYAEPTAKAKLMSYNIDKLEETVFAAGINSFTLSSDGKALAYWSNNQLRVVSTDIETCTSKDSDGFTRKSGWVDFSRIKLSIEPGAEWKQMFAEAWRLQKEFFWSPEMSNIQWQKVFDLYAPLVDRTNTRSEISDLIWEIHGELGTSHAYEVGGDYRPHPPYYVGFLGADLSYDHRHQAYRFERILSADTWHLHSPPPLKRPGVNISEGMLLLAINGQQLSENDPPQKLLVNYIASEVQLTVSNHDGSNRRNVNVKTIGNEAMLRYREWVENNRKYVHEATGGKVGYVHIPDMGPNGYGEFHRYYLSEYDRGGLIVDVRFNGGGHVSQLILEKLSRKRLGFDLTRWVGHEPYPSASPAGPIVAITNEQAGSDGDIFSHSFKMLQLGKLIGMRTWGGVIGIWPRNGLVDGSYTTQPEFSFWFKDVGWKVENYGAEPDIEIDIAPQDYAQGIDPQLDRAIAEIIQELKTNPPLQPDFSNKPDLSLPW